MQVMGEFIIFNRENCLVFKNCIVYEVMSDIELHHLLLINY